MFWSELVVNLDAVLVPTGFLFLVSYHIYLVYKIKKDPNTTVIGFENGNRRVWVQQMMKDMPNNTASALEVLSNNASAAVYLATFAITISSFIGTIAPFATSSSSASSIRLLNGIFFGSQSSLTFSIKYVSLLLCFLVAFISYVQCLRYYKHVNFIISTPNSTVPVYYVEKAVIRASNFWSLGIRAYCFAFPLLLWISGPIAMFVCCLGLICFLYFLDFTANPVPAFGIKSSSKLVQDTVLDIGYGIESSNGLTHDGLPSHEMP